MEAFLFAWGGSIIFDEFNEEPQKIRDSFGLCIPLTDVLPCQHSLACQRLMETDPDFLRWYAHQHGVSLFELDACTDASVLPDHQ